MAIGSVLSKRLPLTFALALAAIAAIQPSVLAQAPEQSAEDKQLEALLTGAELFYKKQYNENSQRWDYQVAWSDKGDTSMMSLYLRQLGTRGDGSKIMVVYAWTQVGGVAQGEDLPPGAIKAVAAFNDTLYTGNVSAAGNGVYANVGIVMTDLSADALWTYLWDMHDNRMNLKKELDPILAGG
jgi:hypothetical protein